MITSAQIRAARGLLDWSRRELAEKSGVGFSSLLRLESFEGVPSSNVKTLEALKKAFEEAGVEFIGTPDDRPGVRLSVSNKP
ncbi:helix-turn-helix domain-containing protein [Polynucleobacter victoriensis]|uniref:Helix-turn-helix n=1 Tax=Polynucleobacter victoriensis TaxID=2049319 RepID=A0A212T8A4_9BURK|nr:helix-turn-helix transcriptional regulator [Polynucleobacter victoriensis]SNC62262.1 Helix-turn-helix [Polynucleobacter victoriensis]